MSYPPTSGKIRRPLQNTETSRHACPLHGELAGAFRLRLGDYRVLFTLQDGVMRIFGVRHRSDAYCPTLTAERAWDTPAAGAQRRLAPLKKVAQFRLTRFLDAFSPDIGCRALRR
jgi:hypothetical protein